MKRNLFVGILAAATFGAVMLVVQLNLTTGIGATTPAACMTPAEFIAALKFEVKQPTYVPDGYSLQCQKAELYQAYTIYAPNMLSTSEVEKSITQDGAVVVLANDETMSGTVQTPSPEERVKQDTRLVSPELAQAMSAKYLTINGHPAWVREAGDYGTLTVQFSNGTVVSVEKTHEPARLHLYVGNTTYVIIGYVPAAELVKMAESIK